MLEFASDAMRNLGKASNLEITDASVQRLDLLGLLLEGELETVRFGLNRIVPQEARQGYRRIVTGAIGEGGRIRAPQKTCGFESQAEWDRYLAYYGPTAVVAVLRSFVDKYAQDQPALDQLGKASKMLATAFLRGMLSPFNTLKSAASIAQLTEADTLARLQ